MIGKKKIGPWRVEGEHIAFDNPWITIAHHDVIHPNGAPGEYGVVRFKNIAIGVLPVDENGMTTLVGQHRFPHDKYSWELPEGGGKLDVSPLESAKRELAEETGMRANDWRELCAFDISNSVTDERAICYIAWNLDAGEASPDPSEALALKQISFRDLLEMVIAGEISDSLTIVMVLTAWAKALRGALPAPICASLLAGIPQK